MALSFVALPGERLGLHAPMTPRDRALYIAAPILNEFGLTWADVRGKSRAQSVVRCRHLVMRELSRARKASGGRQWTNSDIGRLLCKDHTTVRAALQKGSNDG